MKYTLDQIKIHDVIHFHFVEIILIIKINTIILYFINFSNLVNILNFISYTSNSIFLNFKLIKFLQIHDNCSFVLKFYFLTENWIKLQNF